MLGRKITTTLKTRAVVELVTAKVAQSHENESAALRQNVMTIVAFYK